MHSDFLAERRREMLYKKWYESVSRPLLQKIQDKIDSQSSEEIEERKRKQLALYLNHCNKKVLVKIFLLQEVLYLQCHPDSELSPAKFSGTYSTVSVYWIAAPESC